MIRTEIDLTQAMPLHEFAKAVQRIEYAYDQKEYETTVHIESGDLTDEIHRLVFITSRKAE